MFTTLPKLQSETKLGTVELSVVVPCFNEELGLEQLHERLHQAIANFQDIEIREIILVDDGSGDSTWRNMQQIFGDDERVKLVRHPKNLGITAAIRSGVSAASSKWVATIDADCTYDPIQLRHLASLVSDDVAMVTASPYHPKGQVIGVPSWRLALSKIASKGYRMLLKQKLHTYTSCFRIYRRDVWSKIPSVSHGFVGVAEIAWRIDQLDETIVESPAILTTRKIGFSKMRTVPVIRQHLVLMMRILKSRLFPRTN